MPIYYKVAGIWTDAGRPYVKRSGVWTPVKNAYVKRSGVWTESYAFDSTPPDTPNITVELVNTSYVDGTVVKSARHLKVGVRCGATHVEDLKQIYVLATTTGGVDPTSYYGTGYVITPDLDWPSEPWSYFYFNGNGGSSLDRDSSEYQYKSFPPGVTPENSVLQGNLTYTFVAWAVDINDNISAPATASLFVPLVNATGSTGTVKDKSFQADNAGSITTGGFTSGKLTQQNRPKSDGIWLYHNAIPNQMGKDGTPTIKSAQIRVSRVQNDGGNASANVNLYWHNYGGSGDLPASVTDVTRHNTTKVGTIAKGETKWFDIPETFWSHIENDEVKGFGLHFTDGGGGGSTAKDFLISRDITNAPRNGEVHIVWTETPT